MPASSSAPIRPFWDRPGSTSVLWVSTLASILTMGAHIYVVRGNEPPVPPKELRRLAIRLLIAGDFSRAPPLSVEALMLCAMTRVKSSSDADPLLWSDLWCCGPVGAEKYVKSLTLPFLIFVSSLSSVALCLC